MKKVMFIGGNNDFTNEIINRFSADQFSRSNGYDIDHESARSSIGYKSLNYDVVILHTYTGNNGQTLLLQEILRHWINDDKKGILIITGSIASHYINYKPNPDYWVYTAHKTSLDTLCKVASKKCIEGKYKFKISIVKPGMLDSERSRNKSHFINGISSKAFTDTLEHIINLPNDIHIPELILETTYV